MKQLQNISTNLKKSLVIGALFFFQSIAWAQDKEVDVNLNLNEGASDWYAQPWLLVVGAAVFIIIIVALLRGKSSN
jgi:CHASE3 domain sensor protein